MKKKKVAKKANVNHIAHQIGVSGVGAHKNKKAYTRKNKHKLKGDL